MSKKKDEMFGLREMRVRIREQLLGPGEGRACVLRTVRCQGKRRERLKEKLIRFGTDDCLKGRLLQGWRIAKKRA